MSEQIWQKELKKTITSTSELFSVLDINPPYPVNTHFPIKVTPLYLSCIEKNNPFDPLLLQVLAPKQDPLPAFSHDPLQEEQFQPTAGLIHKYTNRVLITFTGSCMIHCQYCFRQHFPYSHNLMTPENWQAILHYLQTHPIIDEVILSGGDPLTASNTIIEKKLADLSQISHIKTIRLHSRIPSVMPCRIDEGLLQILKNCPKQIVIITHINHPNELIDENQRLLSRLANDHLIFNQSVLLRSVNNNPDTLAELSHKLFASRVIPYYLHKLDHVLGAEFYYLSQSEINDIYDSLKARISGYLLPRLVTEIAGQASKTPL